MRKLTASTADKYRLYGEAVQTPGDDARFLARYFKRLTGRPLRILREDFCGTANILIEFIRLHRENRGIGVDLDPEPLEWCRRHNLASLSPQERSRILLLQQDVLLTRHPRADLIAAFNFSHCVLKTRKELNAYFRTARQALGPGGIFIVDNHGGTDVPVVGSETWRCGKFKYTWEVADFDPLSHHIVNKIHFLFPDGSRIKDAFVYHWRLWTLPELQDAFAEAGFRNVQVLWECAHDSTGFGNGVMRRVTRARLEGAWYAMVAGQV